MLTSYRPVAQSLRPFGLLAWLLLASFSVEAQENPLAVRASVRFNSVPLGEVLDAISAQAGVSFSYNPKKIQPGQKITYAATNRPISGILDDLSAMGLFDYEVVETKIVLTPKAKAPEDKAPKATLSGFIRDSSNGEALIGASVWADGLMVGTTSNVFGFYSLTLPAGRREVTYSYIGYGRMAKTIDLSSSRSVDISLEAAPALLKEIVVSGAGGQALSETQTSSTHLPPGSVLGKPSFFGEPDGIKSLEMIPGVKLHSDGSTFYYVRGGDRDQNLILVDDAPVFNPNHLLGLFSTIIPEAVNDITFYAGDMPASLGGRLSSIMDVRTRKGNDQHFAISGNVALLSSRLGLEGPIKKGKSSFMLSGRLSRIKWIFEQGNDDIEKFRFHDLNGKINFDLAPHNKLYLSFYNGGDKLLTTTSGIEWSNHTTSVRWNHVFSNRLFLNTTLAAGEYDYFLVTDRENQVKWNSHVANATLKGDFSYFKNPNEEFDFGVSFGGYNFNPGNLTRGGVAVPPIVSVRNSNEFVMYGSHRVGLGERWDLDYGLRISSWTNAGKSFEFIFDGGRNPVDTLFFDKGEKYKGYQTVEPRLSISYNVNDNSAIKASASRNVQNVHQIANSISPFSSFEVWLPSSINIKPQTATQWVLGYYRNLPQVGLFFEVESFYKKMKNQIDYEAHAETLLNPLLERELRFGEAEAYGVEVQMKKQEGRLRAWAGYSYARAKRKFPEVNGGKVYNAFYDRPHQVNLSLGYDLGPRWNIGLNWNYYTGAPFTSPVGFYGYNGLEVPVYGRKNNDRLPDYHRLDFSATWDLNRNRESKFRHNIVFSIYNLYGRKNVLFFNYNKAGQPEGGFKVPSNLLDERLVTTQFYLFRFTPAISYNFKWR